MKIRLFSLAFSLLFLALMDAPALAQGDFPLHQAAESGNLATLSKLLRDYPNEIDAEDEEGETALMEAAEEGRLDAVELLLNLGACVNHQDRSGETALMEAAEEGRLDVVELLLRRGASLGSLDQAGMTVLQRSKNEKIRQLLRARGARN